MTIRRLHLAGLVGLSVLGLAGTAQAQAAVVVDTSSFNQRLDRIEKRLDALDTRHVATGDGVSGVNAYTGADLERRMGEVEQESSKQQGQLDRMQYAIDKLAKRFDDVNKDLDLRMNDIEARMQKLEEAKGVAAVPAAQNDAKEAPAATSAVKKSSEPPAPAIPAGMSAEDLYNKAYAYLTAADYDKSRVWLETFLKRYPKDKLADNAHYWLGEVYLVKGNPSAAAVSFRDGLKDFPHGAKAAANMLKMGVALQQLKKPDLAKGIWEQLIKTYPHAPESDRAKDKLVELKQSASKK